MIQLFSERYKKPVAWCLFFAFYLQLVMPVYVQARNYKPYYLTPANYSVKKPAGWMNMPREKVSKGTLTTLSAKKTMTPANVKATLKSNGANFIGGPNTPEASSFKAVGSNNLVNLFNGDFSYSVPLLDVGGYPVNLFYRGGIGMEDEASWVGLGWNINPGSVSRNMRGVPDDFNGEDEIIQEQNLRPNVTYGGETGVEIELLGLKTPKLGLSLGFSYNNYLGPSLETGVRLSLAIPISNNALGEKSATSLSVTPAVGAKLSSRSGMTYSASLNANLGKKDKDVSVGVGLSTSYNSRTGMKDLTVNSGVSFKTYNGAQEGKSEDDPRGTTASLGSATISFAKPSFLPALRMPMENSHYSGQIELGLGYFGVNPDFAISGYYSESKVPVESRLLKKPMVGFLYSENAVTNRDAVMDLTRVNDGYVTPKTPVISAPQYAYDIFSIQGEGTGGMIRAYRGDMGFMRDNVTTSKDKSLSVSIDLGIPFHYGTNLNTVSTPTRTGGWEDGNNTLHKTMSFKGAKNNSSFENVYFRNPGETSVSNPQAISRIGDDNLVKFQLTGSNVNPRLESKLEQFDKHSLTPKGLADVSTGTALTQRDKRTQVTTMLTAYDASRIGLEKQIRNYSGSFDGNNNLVYDTISRVSSYRKKHHISEIDVLEQTGMRYVYGIPVYSTMQKDFTFSVDALSAGDNLVNYAADEPTTSSRHMNIKGKMEGYVQNMQTPAYASSFLITGLLSPDYVDVNQDGITEDDLGGFVKFNYNKSDSVHRWRTPRNNDNANTASLNEGKKTEKKDNKAIISYGERESWYLNSIESKSMVAIFKTESRNDAKGVKGAMDARVNSTENVNKRLKQIDLYTKAEIKAKGISNARPLKSVFFTYNYSLCKGTKDNATGGGKLTLASVYFTYNGQPRAVKDRYVFNYGDTSSAAHNPTYAYNGSDKWGTYKDATQNPAGMANYDYPYTLDNKTKNDQYAGAWSLKKILLPSGGQMEIQYEADDYAYTQDRRASNMFAIYGLGKTTSYSAGNSMYNLGLPSGDNNYVYIHLAKPLTSTGTTTLQKEIKDKYLEGVNQLAFSLLVDMPKGYEPITVYAEYEDYGVCANSGSKDYIYIKLKNIEGKSPLAKTVISYLTEELPGQAFDGYEIETTGLQAFFDMIGPMLTNLNSSFQNVDVQMRLKPRGRNIDLAKSFVRLNNPLKMKYGGGARVKKVLVKDNWNKMTGQYNSVYGQEYDYTSTEKINGRDTIISSGVASYEPGIGSLENPFREILSFKNKLPLAPAQYGAIEVPVLEGLYPSPSVGYSKVTVRSIHRKGTHGDSSLRSAIGKQVTEFYTAREYPAYSANTGLSIMDYDKNPFFSFFKKEIINRRVLSQGFLVETNDMHGKMKRQSAYSESDEKTPLSYSYYTYKNTGKNGLNDKVDFVYPEEGGAIRQGNMGVDMELMTDVREYKLESNGFNGHLQVDIFTIAIYLIPIPTFFPTKTYIENRYRAVTTTKLINYHAIPDSVIVMDKGSVIGTRTAVYDAETGSPVVTETLNEFRDSIYKVSYPAHWAYSGAGPAYKNTGMQFSNVNFLNGSITGFTVDQSAFESGDELYVTNAGTASTACIGSGGPVTRLWAFDKRKNATPVNGSFKQVIFIDSAGYPYSRNGVSFRIVRSGHRNNLGLSIAEATMMKSPVRTLSGQRFLLVDDTSKVVAASAMELKEKWQSDADNFIKRTYYKDSCTADEHDSLNCSGEWQRNVNPYLKGLMGNLKPWKSYVFYGDRMESDPTATTATRKNGYIKDFSPYWKYDMDLADTLLYPDRANAKWVWNSELMKVNAKGQELETRDALNRYTAAQYGFNKSMAVAMTQNARYGESLNESFEDYKYTESLNNASAPTCPVRYVDFKNLTNSSIIHADSAGFRAHSGKYVLKVEPASTATRSFSINNPIDSFGLQVKDSIKTIASVGPGTIISQTLLNSIYSIPTAHATTTYGNLEMTADQNWGSNPSNGNLRYDQTTEQYTNVATGGTYTFVLEAEAKSTPLAHLPGEDYRAGIHVTLTHLATGTDYHLSHAYWVGGGATTTTVTYNVSLPCGMYKIRSSGYGHFFNTDGHVLGSTFSYKCSTLVSYSGVTCNYRKPIPVTDSLVNTSAFGFKAGKQMQFSAWMKQDCSGTPCYKTSYDSSLVQVNTTGGGASSFAIKPVGAIIEGWQKVEGVFTVPAGATGGSLQLVNNSHKNIYFDDVRLHPFNANMKTYVYSPRTLRLVAELDENNYAAFYEYDEEGQLIRVKKETVQGIKTIKETRSAKQKDITEID